MCIFSVGVVRVGSRHIASPRTECKTDGRPLFSEIMLGLQLMLILAHTELPLALLRLVTALPLPRLLTLRAGNNMSSA